MFVALHEIGMRICLADCTIKEDIHAETLAVLNEKNKKKQNKSRQGNNCCLGQTLGINSLFSSLNNLWLRALLVSPYVIIVFSKFQCLHLLLSLEGLAILFFY